MLGAKSARQAVAQVLCVLVVRSGEPFPSCFMNMGSQLGRALTAWLTPVIAQPTVGPLPAAAIFSGIGGVAWLLVEPQWQGS